MSSVTAGPADPAPPPASSPESATDALVILDEGGVIHYVNAAAAAMAGAPASAIVGRSLAERLPPAEAERQLARLRACLAQDQTVRYFSESVRLPGERWFETTLLPLRGPAGQRWVLSVTRVVAAQYYAGQTAAEARQRLTQAVFSAVFEHAPLSIAVTALPERRILAVNPAFVRQTGYAAEELVGRPAGHFNLWLDEADRETMLAELAARGFAPEHVVRYRHKSGAVRRSLFSAVQIELDGQPALLSLSQDVTPQYESDERFRATLRHAQVVAYSQDLDLRYTWVGNPRPPLVPEVMLGRTDADLLPPERAAPLTALKRQVLDSGVGLRTEITTEWAGRPFVYDLMLEPLRDAAGAVIGLTGVSIDITARRAAEAELARTETLIGIIHAVGARLQASLKVEGIVAALADGLRQLGLQAAILQLTPDQAALRLVGHTLDAPTVAAAEQVLGRPLSDFLLPASYEGRPAGALRPAPSFFALDASTLPLQDILAPVQWDQLTAVPGLKLNAPILFKPLVAEERLLGWLEVWGPDLREADQPAYTVLASYLAIALEHARLVEALQTSQGRLAALSLGLVEVQEAERRAVARELHDEIGQALTGLRLLLENTVTRTDRLELAEARAVLTDLIGRVQALSLDLRPAILDDLGLEPALRWHLQRFQARTGLRVDLSTRGLDRRFDNLVETTAYRIVQEALTNIVRHAGVGQAWVRAWVTAERLGLEITDEGRGFDVPAALAAHLSTGLSAMRERIQLLGGRLEIDAIPGEGTRILAELPLQPAGGPGREA